MKSPDNIVLFPEENTRCKYEELADTLRKKVTLMASGARLPSVRSLMKRYNLSLQTVNAALKKLEEENLISPKRGSGIYVSDSRMVKFILLHRSRHPSPYEDLKENVLHRAITAAGWHLVISRHEAIVEDDPSLFPEPKACAHLVTQDLANLKLGLLHQLLQQKVPVIVLDRESELHGLDHISSNDQQMFILLIKKLRNLGHLHFAMLVNEPEYKEVQRRKQLFLEVLEMLDLPPGIAIECHTQPGQQSSKMAYQGLKTYVEERGGDLPFTALIVASTAGGAGALRAFYEMKIKVPEQCSVAICGYDTENALCIPSLTDAGTPPELWGEGVVRLLNQRFNQDLTPSLGVKLPVELTLRESISTVPARA